MLLVENRQSHNKMEEEVGGVATGRCQYTNFAAVLTPKYSFTPPFFGICATTALALSFLTSTGNAAAPAAPDSFTGISLKPREVLLTWQDNSDNEDSFEFFISQDNNASWSFLGRTAADSTSINITGFPVGITIGVKIRAVNADGASEFTEVYLARLFEASLTTNQPCLRLEIGDVVCA